MVNENFDQFIKTEAKHKSAYLGSDQENSRKKYKNDEEINSRSNTDMSVGEVGRDIDNNNRK